MSILGAAIRALVVWLGAMLLVAAALPLQATEVFYTNIAKKLFPAYTTFRIGSTHRGLTFLLEDCPCVAIPSSAGVIRYIFLFPEEKGKKSVQAMQKARPMIDQLAKYLSAQFGSVSIYPFADNETGYAISINDSSQYESRVYSPLGVETTSAISYFLSHSGAFYRCDGGEVVLKMEGAEDSDDPCYLSLSLLKSTADVVCFVPGRSLRRADDRLVSAAASLLNLSNIYTSSYSSYQGERLKNMKSYTGATKCLAAGTYSPEINRAIVSCRNRFFVGKGKDLKDYIRNMKRSNSSGKFEFPKQSNSIPEVKTDSNDDSLADEEADDHSVADSISAICKYFRCSSPVIVDDIAYICLRGCRVAIPVPNQPNMGRESCLNLPIADFYVRSDSGNLKDSTKYAALLQKMLDIPQADKLYCSSQVVRMSTGKWGAPKKDATYRKSIETLAGRDFPDSQVHEWPERTVTGSSIPEKLKSIHLEFAGSGSQDSSKGSSETTETISPEQAMRDYIEYLRRLMK